MFITYKLNHAANCYQETDSFERQKIQICKVLLTYSKQKQEGNTTLAGKIIISPFFYRWPNYSKNSFELKVRT